MKNVIVIMGNMVDNPTITYLDSGKSVTKFTIAVNSFVNGEKSVSFYDCEQWESEFIAEKCKKGDKLIVQGQLVKKEYKNKKGENKIKYTMNVYKVAFDNAYLTLDGYVSEVEQQDKKQIIRLEDSDITIINYTKNVIETGNQIFVIGTLSMFEGKPYLNVIKIEKANESEVPF